MPCRLRLLPSPSISIRKKVLPSLSFFLPFFPPLLLLPIACRDRREEKERKKGRKVGGGNQRPSWKEGKRSKKSRKIKKRERAGQASLPLSLPLLLSLSLFFPFRLCAKVWYKSSEEGNVQKPSFLFSFLFKRAGDGRILFLWPAAWLLPIGHKRRERKTVVIFIFLFHAISLSFRRCTALSIGGLRDPHVRREIIPPMAKLSEEALSLLFPNKAFMSHRPRVRMNWLVDKPQTMRPTYVCQTLPAVLLFPNVFHYGGNYFFEDNST